VGAGRPFGEKRATPDIFLVNEPRAWGKAPGNVCSGRGSRCRAAGPSKIDARSGQFVAMGAGLRADFPQGCPAARQNWVPTVDEQASLRM